MHDIRPAAPVPSARRQRIVAALAAVFTLLAAAVVAAAVLAHPASATTVPGPPALDDRVQRQLRRRGRIAGKFGQLEVRHRSWFQFRHGRDRDHDQLDE